MTTNGQRAAFPFIVIDDEGLRLTALRCSACGASFAEAERLACARCGADAGALDAFTPAVSGKLHAASIVRRGYPGVAVPFISAIVDLDGGPTLKGVLRSATFEPHEIVHGRRVRVVFDDSGHADAEGNRFISHFFEPADQEPAQ
ncbi:MULTISPECIES: Zn-ribbon domain-containing OB-fold protein [Sphingobium]|uniref:Zn-ribbon domain-containing OB-fold protein n=1 Tax=Sphingobium TaxID=165695 RepID=UPI00159C44E2|nr:OB-fold domain-containing protein [Sphingobium sp. 15-1]